MAFLHTNPLRIYHICRILIYHIYILNRTPFVRQYDVLSNKWGAVHREQDCFLHVRVPVFISVFFIFLYYSGMRSSGHATMKFMSAA